MSAMRDLKEYGYGPPLDPPEPDPIYTTPIWELVEKYDLWRAVAEDFPGLLFEWLTLEYGPVLEELSTALYGRPLGEMVDFREDDEAAFREYVLRTLSDEGYFVDWNGEPVAHDDLEEAVVDFDLERLHDEHHRPVAEFLNAILDDRVEDWIVPMLEPDVESKARDRSGGLGFTMESSGGDVLRRTIHEARRAKRGKERRDG